MNCGEFTRTKGKTHSEEDPLQRLRLIIRLCGEAQFVFRVEPLYEVQNYSGRLEDCKVLAIGAVVHYRGDAAVGVYLHMRASTR